MTDSQPVQNVESQVLFRATQERITTVLFRTKPVLLRPNQGTNIPLQVYHMVNRKPLHKIMLFCTFLVCGLDLKVLGKSVGLCKTAERKDQLYIRLLVSVLRIICENFNPNGLLLARL